jgi:hypothetical protein
MSDEYERLVTFCRAAHAAIEAEYERHIPGFYATTRRQAERDMFELNAKHYLEWQDDDDSERWLVSRALDACWTQMKITAHLLENDPDLPADFDRGYDPNWGNPLMVTVHH